MGTVEAFTSRPHSWLVLCTLLAASAAAQVFAEPVSKAQGTLLASTDVQGGLAVQIGGDDTSLPLVLARTGRFLVHVLEDDAETVEAVRRRLQAAAQYGLVSVNRWDAADRLPYTENLVNLLLVAARGANPAPQELNRVLCPGGVVLAAPDGMSLNQLKAAKLVDVRRLPGDRAWLMGRKPWPGEMDQWSHPRHSAAGNAVSSDVLVGPPRRVRWVVGAQAEVRGLVTAGGRNFYAAALARDAFNGLRLWNRDLVNPAGGGDFVMKNVPRNIPAPVCDGKYLFAVSADQVLALDAATGAIVREYPQAGKPQQLLHDEGMLIVADAASVRALDVHTARLLWNHEVAEPAQLVAGDDCVALIQGRARRGDKPQLVVIDKNTGKVRWKRDDFPWTASVTRCVYYQGLLAYEVSTLNDDGPDNAIHIVSAADGSLLWDRQFLPGMNHRRQARAMFVGDRLWILHGGKDADNQRIPIQCSALDLLTGELQTTHDAGLAHCFPPVATSRYLFAGELDLTNLVTGEVDANRITKAACSSDNGWIPANGLIYVTPKHCVCWPMLRGYAALATERPEGSVAEMNVQNMNFVLKTGVAPPAADAIVAEEDESWPCYRHDAWRSSSTGAAAPSQLHTLWSVNLGNRPSEGPIVADWRENPFVKGPITSPVIAGQLVYVARPDAHEVVAFTVATGQLRWRFTADGRVDTPPTIHQGLCLFGAKSGWVYCLRADNGQMVWKLRAAPLDEQIVAYGQLESPWPVPGSILVVGDTAYFAAGRQSLADGGILIFAVQPASGSIRWVQRLDSVPQQGFYRCSGLEFDNFDLLHREGEGVAMSRWVFDSASGAMSIDPWSAFAKLNTGSGAAMVPRGCWSYAPRHQKRIASYTARRPMVVFRNNMLLGCMQGMRSVYRRDFQLEKGEQFDTKWITGWAASQLSRDGKMPWRSHRLAEKGSWVVDAFDQQSPNQTIDAMVLAKDQLLLASSSGELQIRSISDGQLLARHDLPAPLWDGMAIAYGRLFLSTADGRVLCLGEN